MANSCTKSDILVGAQVETFKSKQQGFAALPAVRLALQSFVAFISEVDERRAALRRRRYAALLR